MNILICGVNWLGDACMSMPALQVFRSQQPDLKITMLTRPALKPLWELHPCIDSTIPLTPTLAGMRKATRLVKALDAQEAYIFPNSWRSALIPYFARVPHRIAQRGHHRSLILTKTVQPKMRSAPPCHQQWEYVKILRLVNVTELPPPSLTIPEAAKQTVDAILSADATPWVGILPGAARGPSKQWPQEHFISAAKQIADAHKCHFVLLGTAAEELLCQEIGAALGERAISLAGKTSLPELTAVLERCSTVLCNDSGGMHLAAAVGVPVVAVYGITAPTKTGPLGDGHHLICADGITASRDVPRDSSEAREALRSIFPQRVAEAALEILTRPSCPNRKSAFGEMLRQAQHDSSCEMLHPNIRRDQHDSLLGNPSSQRVSFRAKPRNLGLGNTPS